MKENPNARLCCGEGDGGADWMEGFEDGLEEGREQGKLEELESFLNIPLSTELTFVLSPKGREVYRKGLWRTLRTLYNTHLHMTAADALQLKMPLYTFVKVFGRYTRKHGVEALNNLIQDGSVKLQQVTLKFDARKLTNIKEIQLNEHILP